jgi:DNA-binding SARP family transcriptional activator
VGATGADGRTGAADTAEAAIGPLTFGVLGPLALWSPGRPAGLGEPRQRAVLGVLLIEVGQTVAIERLVELVWGAPAPATARKAVQGYVSRLRRLLDGAPRVILRTEHDGYRLDCPSDEVDLHRFQRLVRPAQAEPAPALRRDLLDEALALWRGPALADVGSRRMRDEMAPVLEEERLAALEDRFDADLRLGCESRTIGPLRAMVAEHPFRERSAGLLMVALHRCGRSSEAAEVFRALRHRLVRDIGMEPSQMLTAVHRAILAGQPVLPPPAPVAHADPRRNLLDAIGRVSAAHVDVLIDLGERHWRGGDVDRALSCFHAARALAGDGHDQRQFERASTLIAIVHAAIGDRTALRLPAGGQ